jgi:hypothetical protein
MEDSSYLPGVGERGTSCLFGIKGLLIHSSVLKFMHEHDYGHSLACIKPRKNAGELSL